MKRDTTMANTDDKISKLNKKCNNAMEKLEDNISPKA